MIRGTRRPGGAGRRSGGRSFRKAKGSGGSKNSGCALFLVFAGSVLMLGSGAAGLALAMVTR